MTVLSYVLGSTMLLAALGLSFWYCASWRTLATALAVAERHEVGCQPGRRSARAESDAAGEPTLLRLP